MKKVHARRLLRLADFLDRLPKERFDFRLWVGNDWAGKQDLSCGTTGCALGWAATMPEFRRLGLRLVRFEAGDRVEGTVALKDASLGFSEHPSDLAERAARKVFGLNRDGFSILFTPSYVDHVDGLGRLPAKATAKQVAKNIREFVKKGGSVPTLPPQERAPF